MYAAIEQGIFNTMFLSQVVSIVPHKYATISVNSSKDQGEQHPSYTFHRIWLEVVPMTAAYLLQ